MARPAKLIGSSTTLLSIYVLMCIYLFPCKIGTNVFAKTLGNKKLSALMECPKISFLKDQ
jgi:hypothetical protein